MFNALKLRNRILGGYSVPIVLSLLVTGIVFINQDLRKYAIYSVYLKRASGELKEI